MPNAKMIAADQLRTILKRMPQAIGVYTDSKNVFSVYRAKDLHAKRWNSPALKKIALFCRLSYRRYGNRPPFDAYDAKAAIYLVRASSPTGQESCTEEWLSIRMVPGDSRPVGVAEPEIYRARGKSLDFWIKKKIGTGNIWHMIISSSRMCGIHPYRVAHDGKIAFLKENRHQNTAICFALLHKQFVQDYPLAKFPYRYVTAIIRPDFYRNRLVYRQKKITAQPLFTPAYRFLGMKTAEVAVERKIYSYAFPDYWLHMQKLLASVNQILKKQAQKPLQKIPRNSLAGLAKSEKRSIRIGGIAVQADAMRKLIDRSVPDIPELKITPAKPWYHSMDTVLRAAKIVPAR